MRNIFASGFAIVVASAALLAGISGLYAAPTEAQQQAIRSSCQSDYRSYCASVPTGGSAALQCLEQNVAKLSSTCQQAVKAATGGASTTTSSGGGTAPATTKAPATTDAAPADASTPPASSGTSVVIVLKPRQEIALMRQACGADYREHCSGTEIGGGRAVQCLVSHASSLSATCKGALSGLGQKF